MLFHMVDGRWRRGADWIAFGIFLLACAGLTASARQIPDDPTAMATATPPKVAPGSSQASASPAWNVPLALSAEGPHWENLWEDVDFDSPVVVTAPPGETNRLVVVERTGLVHVITNLAAPTKSVFLDLRRRLHSSYLEAGVLGLAFHPGYATNRQFFVFRTVLEPMPDGGERLMDVLSRFETFADDPDRADPASELRLFTQEDWNDAHNAGDLKFGPDGYLYVTVGDETPPAGEQDGTRQPLQGGFFAAVLRLDVDQRPGSLPPNPHTNPLQGYTVPSDNPFHGLDHYFGHPLDPFRVRTEIFAYGFRNPWRMTFDPGTGELIVGDVGGAMFEELNLVRPGGNYGWPFVEGVTNTTSVVFAPAGFQSDPPLYAYAHRNATNQGNSIICGEFYRGTAIPALAGRLIFADCRSGHTWALERGGGIVPASAGWLCTEPGLVTFGVDPRDRELLAANYRTGRLMKLRPAAGDSRSTVPPTLAETGVFTDLAQLTVAPRVHEYTINAPFWSDHAIKRRWVSVPTEGPAPVETEAGGIAYPPGTVWVKHFDLELVVGESASRRRLETRLLVQGTNGFYGVTYRWGESRTNAWLVPEAGLDETFVIRDGDLERTQIWHYPGRSECVRCHNALSGPALGYSPGQLDRSFTDALGTGSQLERLRGLGQLPATLTSAAVGNAALIDPHDESRPLEQRVRSYLASNCASCHVPGRLVDTGASWDARLQTPLEATGLLDGRLVAAQDLWNSRLYLLVARYYDDLVMPLLGSNVRDEFSVALLEQWILSLPPAPWARGDFGDRPGLAGYSTWRQNTATVSSPGAADPSVPLAKWHFLHRPLGGEGFFEARLSRFEPDGPAAVAGLALGRAPTGNSEASPAATNGWALAVDGNQRPGSFALPNDGSFQGGNGAPLAGVAKLRWTRNGHLAFGDLTSELGATIFSTRRLVESTGDYEAGLFASGTRSNGTAHAWFDGVAWANVRWLEPADAAVFAGRSTMSFTLEVDTDGTAVTNVEFLAGETVIGVVDQPPYQLHWTNPPAGQHSLSARVNFTQSKPFRTTARRVTVQSAPLLADPTSADPETGGAWLGVYGNLGYALPGATTNLPAGTVLRVRTGTPEVWPPTALPLEPLALPGSASTIASGWWDPTTVELEVLTLFDDSRQVSLGLSFAEPRDGGVIAVEILDANTGALVDQRQVEVPEAGDVVYATWTVRGSVLLRASDFAAESAVVVRAVFLDPPATGAGEVRLVEPSPAARFVAPAEITWRAEPLNSLAPPRRVELFANGVSVATAEGPEFSSVWSAVPTGSYDLFARAWNGVGEFRDTPVTRVEVEGVPPAVEFLGTETVTRGAWVNRWGGEGFAVPLGAMSLPTTVSLTFSNTHTWNWQAVGQVLDLRAPSANLGGGLQATCWTSPEGIEMDLELRDGRPHVVSLYLVDWDTNLRREWIEWIDPRSGQVLAAHYVPDFFSGVYVAFRVQGSVRARLRSEAINAVLSGFFLDALAPPMENEPYFTGLIPRPEGLELRWQGPPGSLFRIQAADALPGPWMAVPIIVTSATAEYSFVDPWPQAGRSGARYFQLELLTTPPSPPEN